MARYIWVFFALATTAIADAQTPGVFREGRHGPAELKFASGIPILTVSGTPAEIGEQVGILAGKQASDPLPTLNQFLADIRLKDSYPAMKKVAGNLKTNFPADHLLELEATATAAGYELEMLLFMNSVYDLSSGMGCSTLIAEKTRSETGGPLFGRNFDWIPSAGLPERTLILVAKPTGKHAFASITLAPITGVISGMNDAGLCVTINEVRLSQSKDLAKTNWTAVPTLMAFRRVLEECQTVAEAEKLLRAIKRMTSAYMTICDPNSGAVFEFTPKSFEVRSAENGICRCTNHFLSTTLAIKESCDRIEKLAAVQTDTNKLSVNDVFDRLNDVHQKKSTLQSMVFEPATRTLHLKLGDGKTTATKSKAMKFDLGAIFDGK
jgi:isopenicillin-N N-acyltransferase like protein